MKLIAIADTHGLHSSLEIPDSDILIHAGDHVHLIFNQTPETTQIKKTSQIIK